tara:strand:+ start:341 stop:1408 length:1068 start_codon:yes stop_codon:yes gene_type:complete
MESTEIQLFSDTFDVNQLTSQETRENLYLSINQLDVNNLSDRDIRSNFNGIRVALGVFIRKFVELEGEIKDVKLGQIAYESKMERLFLKSRTEIQELKQELNTMRSADRQMEKVVQVAKLLKDNNYAPVAIKSMMRGITNGEVTKDSTAPEDFTQRIEWAQTNGFRWNKNNRPPAKIKKQIDLLETWEMEFHKARSLPQNFLLDKDFVLRIGKGAPAGALSAIEEILGYQLIERKKLSTFNCYQRSIKLLEEKLTNYSEVVEVSVVSTNLSELVYDIFGELSKESYNKIIYGLNKLPADANSSQILSQIKIYFSIDLFPRFIDTTKITNPLTLLPKLQSTMYDSELIRLINQYIV